MFVAEFYEFEKLKIMKDKKRDKIVNEAIAFIHVMSEDTVSENEGKKLIKKLWQIKLCNKHFVSNNEVAVCLTTGGQDCMYNHKGDCTTKAKCKFKQTDC